ncbi:MAG: pyridoxamine 5'-phosphate oxidase family protein [Deltaproteobacteria bacterium]|nr:pyridoxamine 5'-phosphate oxidase family protein [Deltaproteobacteria bacterium]
MFEELFHAMIVKSFSDDDHPAYGQAATTDNGEYPQVRTVHFRYLQDADRITFAANIKSSKWSQIARTPFVAGCYFDQYRLIQFRWEGKAELVDLKSGPKHLALVQKMWGFVRPDVRSAYWLDYKKISLEKRPWPEVDVASCCPTFGIVICTPHLWDIMEVNPEDYRLDRRTIHKWNGKDWESEQVSVLHGKGLY